MSSSFDFFEGTRSENTAPQITVRKSGQMVLTPPAVAMLGDGVTHVQFGYDAKSRTVALRPGPEGAKGRYRLREQSNGTSLADGRRFCAHHGLEVEKARRFDAESFGDGIVGFRLPQAVVKAADEDDGEEQQAEAPKSKTSRGGKRRSAA